MRRFFYILAGIGLFLPILAFAQNDVPQTAFQLFNPSAVQNGTDLSIQYLGDIYGIVDGVLHGSGSQVMGQMFMVFNAGALILGGIIVIYTSLISLLNTANEGEMLGKKWNSIWIPLRTVLGIALLIPKSTGYCAIQIFMMWVIVQGVGLADNVWNSVVGYLAQGGVLVQQSLSTADNVFSTSKTVFRQSVCLAAFQTAFDKAYNQALTNQSNAGGLLPPPNFFGSVSDISTNGAKYCIPQSTDTAGVQRCAVPLPDFSDEQDQGGVEWTQLNGACGSIIWSAGSEVWNSLGNQKVLQAYKESAQVAVQQMLLDMSGPAQVVVDNFVIRAKGTTLPPSAKIQDYVSRLMLHNAAQDYEGIVYPAQRAVTNIAQEAIMQAWAGAANVAGWIEAGAYYQVMTQQNSSAAAAIFTPPKADTTPVENHGVSSFPDKDFSVGAYEVPRDTFTTIKKFIEDSPTDQDKASLGYFLANSEQGDTAATGFGKGLGATVKLGGILAKIAFPLLSPLISVIQSFVGLLTSQSTNANPVVMIAMMGDGLIGIVVEVWIAGALTLAGATAVLAIIPSVEEATTMSVLTEWIIPFLWGIAGVIFIEGAVMAFYVPMIPFILFLFGAIGWFIATVEAMVAAPLVALGITHPEGAEVLGKSDPAVLLLVNVFLRPSMMIIGFIAGIILSYVSIWLLNLGFAEFLVGTASGAGGSLLEMQERSPLALIFSIPFVLVIYVALVISILNYCFALINVVPDKVMRWLGGQVEGVAGEVGRMAGEVKGAPQGAARGIGESAKSLAEKQGGKEDKSTGATGDIQSDAGETTKGESKDKSSEGGDDVKVSS